MLLRFMEKIFGDEILVTYGVDAWESGNIKIVAIVSVKIAIGLLAGLD